ATEAGLLLASALLTRGRARDALRIVDDFRIGSAASADPAHGIELAMLAGDAWIDLARLDEAERVLTAAVAVARTAGDRIREIRASIGLSRCLFWRGAYGEAARLVESAAADGEVAVRVRRLRAVARTAIAQGDSAAALTAVEQARATAEA